MNDLPSELRRLRLARRWNQQQLAKAVGVSKSLITSFETARLIPLEQTAKALDLALGSGDQIQKLSAEMRGDRRPWLRSWRDHERRAVLLRSWEPLLIPGLLQREPYMRQMFAAIPANAGRIDELVKTRLARQAAVFERKPPATIACIVAEFALNRGPREIMKDQLAFLADVGQRFPVTVRVVPDNVGGLHAGLGGPLALATMADGRHIFYLDDQLRGRLATTPSDVSELELSLESINGLALSIEQSRDLILELLNECK
nr:Scr1 family TA system antitoxin-like transcriptional regulator [Micromonospora sp. DSM 115978]